MKKLIILFIIGLISVSNSFAQIESGDKEVSFLGFYSTFVGEDVEPNGYGSLQISYGKYYSRYLQLGFAPTLSFSTGQDENGDPKIDTQLSASVFFNFNLAAASRTIPYFTGRYYQFTFDIPEGAEFGDYSYVTLGFGIQNFINEYAAFNTLGTYGFSLAKDSEGGIVLIMAGLSFIF